MKLKNLFTTLGLAAVLGIGVGAGLAVNKSVKEVKASTDETVFYVDYSTAVWPTSPDFQEGNISIYMWNNKNTSVNTYIWWGGANDNKGGLSSIAIQGTQYVSFSMEERGTYGYTHFIVYAWNMNGSGNQTVDIAFDDAQTGNNSVKITKTDQNWNAKNNVAWQTITLPSATYTITQYANYDGTVDTENPLGTDTVAAGDNYEAPAAIYKNLKHFVGWFEDATCEIAWTTRVINADTSIYAKYVTITVDSYVYWISESQTPVFTHFYAFGEYETAAWPGDALIEDYEVSGVMVFNGNSQKIYKIPVPSNANITMVLNNGSSEKQTYDINVVAGSAYYTWLKEGESKYSYSQNDFAAKALDLLLRAEDIRNAVRKDQGAPANYSICGISAADAASLYNEYFALDTAAKEMVDNTTTKTYDGADVEKEEVQVSYAAIMAQLKKIALNGNQTVNGANGLNVADMDNAAIIVVITAIASISVVCLLLVVKRRKALNK